MSCEGLGLLTDEEVSMYTGCNLEAIVSEDMASFWAGLAGGAAGAAASAGGAAAANN